MICPHCQSTTSFFQALEKVEVLPTIIDWKLLPFNSEVPKHHTFICTECEKRVRIDLVHRHITALDSDPIFDETVSKIMELARAPERSNELIPQNVIDALKTRRFIGIHRLLTGRELVSKIIEQKP